MLSELEQAATRRYGPAWLSRASVAGLVTVTTTAAGTGTAFTTGAAATASPATAATVAHTVTGSAGTATNATAQLAATATRSGARILGMPMAAAITALVIVIAAIAATVVVVTSNNSEPSTSAEENGAAAGTDAGAGTDPGATDAGTVPAFDGTYDVTITLSSVYGNVNLTSPIGSVESQRWEVTSTCPSGPCDVTVASSGGTFNLTYAARSWTVEGTFSNPCVDPVTGVPTGNNSSGTYVMTVTPVDGVGVGVETPVEALSGSQVQESAEGCGGGLGGITQTVEISRVGD